MAIDAGDVKAVNKILWPDEKVEMTVRQRRIGPGGSLITPTSVIATDKRIIVLNRVNLGIRQDFEVIPYRHITSVRLVNGVVASSVFIRIQGFDNDKGLLPNGKQEGEVDGLSQSAAAALANLINKKMDAFSSDSSVPDPKSADYPDSKVGAYVFCTQCDTKNPASSKSCSHCGKPLS